MLAGALYGWAEEQAREICAPARGHRDPARRQPVRRGQGPAAVAGRRGLHQAPHLAADDPPRHARGGDLAARAPRGRHHPPGGQPRERAAGRERPAPGPRDARVVLRGPLQLLPGELPRVRPAAARGPRAPVGPLVAGVRRGRRRRAARRRRAWSAPCSPENAAGHEGSYIEYIGVHRHARGRGVAKALLHTVIADAARRGRDRVGLEVDADSPTGADGLYASMGWETDYVLESWFKELDGSLVNDPEVIGRRAEQSTWLDHAARIGLVAYGVVHLLIAWLAIQLALGDQSEDASAKGALHELAKQPFGKFMVWAVALGMLLLVVWRVTRGCSSGTASTKGPREPRLRLASAGQGHRVRRPGRDRCPGGAGLRELQQLVAELSRYDGQGDGPARRTVDRCGRRSRGHRVRRGRDRPARLEGGFRRGPPDRGQAGLERGGIPPARQGRPHRQGRRPDRSSAR